MPGFGNQLENPKPDLLGSRRGSQQQGSPSLGGTGCWWSDGGETGDKLPVEVAGSKELLELLDCCRLRKILVLPNLLQKRGAAGLGDHVT